MTVSNRESSILRVLAHEGGYTNHPTDPGGPTNWGITIADARMYWRPGATAQDVKAMPRSVAVSIYQQKYWARMRCDELRSGVDYAIMDYGVNSGTGRAGKVLRRVLRMPDNTSAISDDVIRIARGKDPHELVSAICDERMRFLRALKTFPTFGKGWTRRVAEVRSGALNLADRDAQIPSVLAPSITPTQPGEVMASARVPVPAGLKQAVTAAPAAAGGGAAATWHGWVAEHTLETGLILAGGVVLVGGALYAIRHWHEGQQDAVPEGWMPPVIQDAPIIPVAA